MPDFDTILHPDFLVPMMPRREILTGRSVAIRAGQIAAILPTPEAQATDAREHVELPGCALMPGLINLHCHAAMSLLRGYADDLSLMTWLQRYIWPTESHFISP